MPYPLISAYTSLASIMLYGHPSVREAKVHYYHHELNLGSVKRQKRRSDLG